MEISPEYPAEPEINTNLLLDNPEYRLRSKSGLYEDELQFVASELVSRKPPLVN